MPPAAGESRIVPIHAPPRVGHARRPFERGGQGKNPTSNPRFIPLPRCRCLLCNHCAYNHVFIRVMRPMSSKPNAARELVPQKRDGAYYTPEWLAAMLVSRAARSSSDALLDPSCGDGRFLAQHGDSVGVERDARAANAARERAPQARVVNEEFFAWANRARRSGQRFHCVVGNPPFIRYQTFNGEVRRRALALCAELGVAFSGLSASWAPFLVVAASLLRKGGRMAFVVPSAIGHAPYAGPLLEFLVARFKSVFVVAVRRKLFPRLSEDCWLLFAEGFGGATDAIDFAAIDAIRCQDALPRPCVRIDLAEWRTAWHRRLRPYLLASEARALYAAAADAADHRAEANGGVRACAEFAPVRFGALADIGLGYVSGANGFFHLTPSDSQRADIPKGLLQTTVRSARLLPQRQLTLANVDRWRRDDEPMLLLRIPKAASVPASVRRYLDSPAGRSARQAYKCRHRTPWYSVPDVRVPDFFLTYMAGRVPNLVRNAARASCSNALHGVRLKRPIGAGDLLGAWHTPLTRLSCELEGHALGGGMLKLELGEAARVILPLARPRKSLPDAEIDEAVFTMRSWRHYAERRLG